MSRQKRVKKKPLVYRRSKSHQQLIIFRGLKSETIEALTELWNEQPKVYKMRDEHNEKKHD